MSELDPFVRALRRQREASASAEVVPDALDVVDRALTAAPDRVPDELRAGVAHATSSSYRHWEQRDRESADLDPSIAPFAEALRDQRQAHVDERRLLPVAQPKRPAVVAWGAALAVAAAVALLVALPPLRTTAESESGAVSGQEAERSATLPQSEGGATQRHREGARGHSATPKPLVEPQPPAPPEAGAVVEPESATPTPARPEAKSPNLDDLETEARAAWKAGDLALAERHLRTVVRRSGSSRRADLAYADLFALARQRGEASAQIRLWKQYLAKFPRGRFADDVRANLCRAIDGERSSRCWQTYLREHPQGAHATQAAKAIGRSGP